jgi:murein DD-endopeptidase MepM/ murein hydrolase activator NlpD
MVAGRPAERLMTAMRALLPFALLLLCLLAAHPSQAQPQVDCGIVDAVDYPIDGVSFSHDDFAMYRAIFNGYHSGIDMAFGRLGAPIRAMARGRITFSDTAGWGDEKGVVIIEHTLPSGQIIFSLYGHMEERGGYTFPPVGRCVQQGEIVGAVGSPKSSAQHLHFEIRTMRASTGGPGYWSQDPLTGGWLHPIEFIEQWRARNHPAFRDIFTANITPITPPIATAEGNMILISSYEVGLSDALGNSLWRLGVKNSVGGVVLPSGRILLQTAPTPDQNLMIVVENGRFLASWVADRPLESLPLRLADLVVFFSSTKQLVAYDEAGGLRWATAPLGTYLERWAIHGNLIAVVSGEGDTYRLRVIDSLGQVAYEAASPAPIIPLDSPFGFLILVGSQVNVLTPDLTLLPIMETGIAFLRGSTGVIDGAGNTYIYPGTGQDLYAFAADGSLRWQAKLTNIPSAPLLMALGAGCGLYTLNGQGQLSAYDTLNGEQRGGVGLYAGGTRRNPALRTLQVGAGEQIQFSAGFLSTLSIDGLRLLGRDSCQPN